MCPSSHKTTPSLRALISYMYTGYKWFCLIRARESTLEHACRSVADWPINPNLFLDVPTPKSIGFHCLGSEKNPRWRKFITTRISGTYTRRVRNRARLVFYFPTCLFEALFRCFSVMPSKTIRRWHAFIWKFALCFPYFRATVKIIMSRKTINYA